ncbi:hypothetical protein [uncultured Muribaculum sp.]|uniref:hypothetical protein n=1 Tax=uncultured Muribaculum sp. TaxID=1918613 RepID=UPI002664F730|nr:hypothetical protein [uncultured Muribaculum sp.]
MTTEQKKEITAYLCGPRDYAEGVALYQRYGVNLRLKRQFAVEDTAVIREILFDELRKLAGLSEIEFNYLPRQAVKHMQGTSSLPDYNVIHGRPSLRYKMMAKNDDTALMELADSFGVTVDELVSPDFQERVLAMDENADRIDELTDELEAARSKYAATPEPVRKMIRFREKYPFLNSTDCPDVLKILVADMFTAYGNYKAAHHRLQVLGDADSATAAADCETVVTEYLKNREIWDELEYYRENGVILGKAAKFREMEAAEDLTKISDVDLMGQLRSAGVQESKAKKAVEEAKAKKQPNEKAEAAFVKWSNRKKILKAEIDRRKKK